MLEEDWLARLGEKDGRKTVLAIPDSRLEVVSSFIL